METASYINFAKHYSKDQFEKIKFNWNGKHGDEFSDTNNDFRKHLCESIKDNLQDYSLDLITDLYLEESKCAKETFGVYLSFGKLAEALLIKGGIQSYLNYVEGAGKSMDTYISSGNMDLPKKLLEELIQYLESEAKEIQDKKFKTFLPRFQHMLKQKTNANT
tara:strand:+ start:16 stop:504 length:489 start_codon:yes stop_codon:yes gene_type:complete